MLPKKKDVPADNAEELHELGRHNELLDLLRSYTIRFVYNQVLLKI